MLETCKKEDIKAFLTLKIKKYYTLWKMADSFVKNISALFLQGFEIGFKKTLERGKYMKKENGVTKQVGKKLNFWQKLWKYRVLTLMCVPAMIFSLHLTICHCQESMLRLLNTITAMVFLVANL